MESKDNGIGWKESSMTNKIGTLLYAVVTVLLLLGWIFALASGDPDYSKGFFSITFPLFVVNLILTIFLFMDVDVVKVIAKNIGYYLIIYILVIALSIYIVLPILKELLSALGALADLLETVFQMIGPEVIGDMLSDIAMEGFIIFFPLLAIIAFIILNIIASFLLSSSDRPKNKICTLFMLILFGLMGGHLSYVNRKVAVVFRIICTVTIVLMPLSFLFCLIDFIKILIGRFKDKQGNYITNWL